ncbi:hypothetical protein K788_0008319 [Paraburkholderia caribensis MBA4]|uniref:Uncharacterized protein n=1 Tax=Paraburkholderia caribensis MBA4 TaxID=1323664 RepID=A0A0P0RF48_9BURK|nr:hypothetical protein K788_0008319 [Paraburkholderia caribensis MBA4]
MAALFCVGKTLSARASRRHGDALDAAGIEKVKRFNLAVFTSCVPDVF